MIKPKSVSLSAIQLFEQCPYKYKQVKILKIPEPKSEALENGIKVHQMAEDFLNGEIEHVPPPLLKFEGDFIEAREMSAIAEENIVLNDRWEPLTDVPKKEQWFHEDAWLRAKTDIRLKNFIVDIKTGKHYDKYYDQAELYALLFFILNPEFTNCHVEFWYTKTGDLKTYDFNHVETLEKKKDWVKRFGKLFVEEEWEPKKNEYCKYCFFQASCPAWNKIH